MSETTNVATVEETVPQEPKKAPPAKSKKKASTGPATKKVDKHPASKTTKKTVAKKKSQKKAKKPAKKAEVVALKTGKKAKKKANRTAAAAAGMLAISAAVLKRNAAKAKRQLDKARAAIKRGGWRLWKGARAALRWLHSKAGRYAKWLVAKAKGLKFKGKSAFSKGRTVIISGSTKVGAYVAQTARGTWMFTAPFRGWVATPFRLALGTTGGLAALLAFGTGTLVLLTAPWVAYLLWSGRLVWKKKNQRVLVIDKSTIKKLKKTRAEQPEPKAEVEPEAEVETEVEPVAEVREISEEDLPPLIDIWANVPPHELLYRLWLKDEIEEAENVAYETEDINERSEAAGKAYAFRRAQEGTLQGINTMAKQCRAKLRQFGPQNWDGVYTLGGVKRGVAAGANEANQKHDELFAEAERSEVKDEDLVDA